MGIREARRQNRLTQKELCGKLGIGQSTLSGWENGKIAVSSDNIKRLCKTLHASADELLGLAEDRESLVMAKTRVSDSDELSLLLLYRELPQNRQKAARDFLYLMMGG